MIVSFMKICTTKATLYLWVYMNLYLSISFKGVKIQHKGFKYNAVEHLLVLQKSAEV
jgi:hypothetical protein